MANQDRVNFVWAESALTTIPPIPVSEVAYRDTTQTPEQMEVGQQYDTIYNSARHNQLLFLLTSVAKTLCENGIMPFLAGQEYSQYARCIFTDGKLYTASRAILANEQPYPTPGDDSGVWIAEETSENLVPNSRRVIAGTGLTGGGPLSSDVTLSAKLDGKTTQAAADGAITVKDVAIGGNLEDLASARGFFYDTRVPYYPGIGSSPVEDFDLLTLPGKYHIVVSRDTLNLPGVRLFTNSGTNDGILEITKVGTAATVSGHQRLQQRFTVLGTAGNTWSRYQDTNATKWFNWEQEIRSSDIGDGIRITNTKLSVPEYEGATASTNGTAGLVPPAAAGQHESFLTGGGEYKPAVQQGGGKGQGNNKIYIGYSESGLKAQADTLDLGNVVTTSAGCTKAPSAANADYANTAKGIGEHSWLDVIDTGGNPQWVVGLATDGSGKIKPILPASLRTAYAWAATTVPSVATGNANQAVPAGGTWTFIVSRNGEGSIGTIAGGTVIDQGVWLAIRVA